MRGLLASPRRRRRLAWAGGACLLAGVAAGLVIAFPSPKRAAETLTVDTTPLPAEPVAHRLAGVERAHALDAAAGFVRTAVARRHVEDSYDLVAPSLRHGFTRAAWARGDIPVVPYPVRSARWRLSYSDTKEVGLQVALYPRPSAKVRAAVFDLTLVRLARNGHGLWLVSAFTPSPVAGVPAGDELSPFGPNLAPKATGKGALSAAWLVVPAGLVGFVVLVLAAFGLAARHRSRRAYRQTSSSSPS